MTRPRMTRADRSWITDTETDVNSVPAAPSGSRARRATGSVDDAARATLETPRITAADRCRRLPGRRLVAAIRAPNRAPAPITAVIAP